MHMNTPKHTAPNTPSTAKATAIKLSKKYFLCFVIILWSDFSVTHSPFCTLAPGGGRLGRQLPPAAPRTGVEGPDCSLGGSVHLPHTCCGHLRSVLSISPSTVLLTCCVFMQNSNRYKKIAGFIMDLMCTALAGQFSEEEILRFSYSTSMGKECC